MIQLVRLIILGGFQIGIGPVLMTDLMDVRHGRRTGKIFRTVLSLLGIRGVDKILIKVILWKDHYEML